MTAGKKRTEQRGSFRIQVPSGGRVLIRACVTSPKIKAGAICTPQQSQPIAENTRRTLRLEHFKQFGAPHKINMKLN